MPATYKICSPWVPAADTAGDLTASDQLAANERVDNIRIHPWPNPGDPPRIGRGLDRPQAAVERLKLWANGRTLRITFLDGRPDVQAKVEAIAKEWEQLCNLRISFVRAADADIRISFLNKGFSWSAVGTDALRERQASPTMNYGWLEPTTELREYQRVVRHEFGHALGMIHEHQNPAAAGAIPWDKPKVYAYYQQQGWSKDQVDFNIFYLYSENSTNHTAVHDRKSIMQYAVPDSLTIGSYSIGWNTEISHMDKEFMTQQYPRGAPGIAELTVDGPRTEAELSLASEVDSYHFNAETAATYIATTRGTTDTVLTLHGPDDPGAVLTWDNDLGQGKNARIVRKLRPGSYWLTVRHQEPGGTGVYSIGVTRRRVSI